MSESNTGLTKRIRKRIDSWYKKHKAITSDERISLLMNKINYIDNYWKKKIKFMRENSGDNYVLNLLEIKVLPRLNL